MFAISSSESSGRVETRHSCLIFEPSASSTSFSSTSTPTTALPAPNRRLSLGSSDPTPRQMAPVPPRFGNLNTALGPHPASSTFLITFPRARETSGAATRSPSHSLAISVVGWAQTLKL